jgi:hypothetical protein
MINHKLKLKYDTLYQFKSLYNENEKIFYKILFRIFSKVYKYSE